MSNNKVDGALCFFRHTQGNNKGELVSVAVNIEKEEDSLLLPMGPPFLSFSS